jgi:hypothetical protein
MVVFKHDTKHRVRKQFRNAAVHLDQFFFCQISSSLILRPPQPKDGASLAEMGARCKIFNISLPWGS